MQAIEPTQKKEVKNSLDKVNLLKKININSKDINYFLSTLNNYYEKLDSVMNVSYLLNYENLDILKRLNEKGNIKISLILSKIYMSIINNDSLYSDFLLIYDKEKMNFIIEIIEECVSLIKKLNGFIYDPNLFKFKKKVLYLIKFIYINHKNKANIKIVKKLEDLLDSTPSIFFSEAYNDLNNQKDDFEIIKSLDIEKISNFEDNFAKINNYFEQFDVISTFVQNNSGAISYSKVSGGDSQIIDLKENNKNINDVNEIEFYQTYGLLLLKFCIFHKYIFSDEEEDSKINKEKKRNENGKENTKILFDKDIEKENKIGKNIIDLLKGKLFVTMNQPKEYNELIIKEIKNYLNLIKNYEKYENFKQLIWQMKFYLKTINENIYKIIALSYISQISLKDNFNPFYSLNVPAGKSCELYFESNMNDSTLIFIELSLEDIDITFELKKYDIKNDKYKNVIKKEKVMDKFQTFILSNGYHLYQIVFDNSYSWFTSKDIYYRISLLKLIGENKNNNIKNDIKMIEIKNNEERLINKIEKRADENKDTSNFKEKEKIEKLKIIPNEINSRKENKVEENLNDILIIKKRDHKYKEKTVVKKNEIKKIDKEESEDNDELINKNGRHLRKEEEQFYCFFNGKKISFNINEINKIIKKNKEAKDGEEIINIPIILFSNSLRIISMKNDEVKFIEKKEEDEDGEIINKYFFDFQIINYIQKNLKLTFKDKKNKKIIISLFNQNRELSLTEEIKEKINSINDSNTNNYEEKINYLQKIGFYPSKNLENYNIEYKLYDLCEQSLLYHLLLHYSQNIKIEKPIYFMLFDKNFANAAIFNQGKILINSTYNEEIDKNCKLNYLSNINISDTKGILKILEYVQNIFGEIELILSYIDDGDVNNKKKVLELFDFVKIHCIKKINISEQYVVINDMFNIINY